MTSIRLCLNFSQDLLSNSHLILPSCYSSIFADKPVCSVVPPCLCSFYLPSTSFPFVSGRVLVAETISASSGATHPLLTMTTFPTSVLLYGHDGVARVRWTVGCFLTAVSILLLPLLPLLRYRWYGTTNSSTKAIGGEVVVVLCAS